MRYSVNIMFSVAGSIVLTSSNYDAFEPDGAVSVCAVIMAEALERRIFVQLSSQDSTARSELYNIAIVSFPLGKLVVEKD